MGCDHAEPEIPDPPGDPDIPVLVDARIAPLVVLMRDIGPPLACEDAMQTRDTEFAFATRSDAVDFITELADFGRAGEFNVAYCRDKVRVPFPVDWVDGLVERYRRSWERSDEEAREADSSEPR